ncbi:MAG: DUF4325 domain-containing protein [Candidatus Lernaella stagnicola]|nr:DUF4325 domain-containing protein [Candidatus Lernaella stagnicola]
MAKVRERGEKIRRFILENVESHPSDISNVTAERFGISRQAVNKHLQRLAGEQALVVSGKTRNRRYELAPAEAWLKRYAITPDLAEDRVWATDLRPVFDNLPENVRSIWQYAFTEIFNNALEHSEGSDVTVVIRKWPQRSTIVIGDNGVGIFKKIQKALGLLDERHAVLELAKGKMTTDPQRHTGEGVFFTSRMMDRFHILSGDVFFSHEFGKPEDWIEQLRPSRQGTFVVMELSNHSARTTKKVFDRFASGDDYSFSRTIVPVRMAQYGDDELISRSQAKRLLARIDLFKTVMFDFTGVHMIGQAFADEIFRVFAHSHPRIELLVTRANSAVKRMIARAKSVSS